MQTHWSAAFGSATLRMKSCRLFETFYFPQFHLRALQSFQPSFDHHCYDLHTQAMHFHSSTCSARCCRPTKGFRFPPPWASHHSSMFCCFVFVFRHPGRIEEHLEHVHSATYCSATLAICTCAVISAVSRSYHFQRGAVSTFQQLRCAGL